eukprot:TRINITY_DN54276_c0_g1_i1.p1 TRINITY_DN54276_c0_g1~~TRINITY_DN54276_c0_g1_i1.p1  ORF type:complete len:272 (-),score=69.09 TRINITY_DN54276_c0_g1_i1:143-958(-)
MERQAGSLPCEMAGARTLGTIFDDLEELDGAPGAREARPSVARAVVRAMQAWPRDSGLLSHCCFALAALAAHGLDAEGGPYQAEHLAYALQPAWQHAVPLAQELDQENRTRAPARYLRNEIIRLQIESLKAAREPQRSDLRAGVLGAKVAQEQCEALLRDERAGEFSNDDLGELLRPAVICLGICGQPEAVLRVLNESTCGAPPLPLTARAVSEAAVDLCRLGLQSELRQAKLGEAAAAARQWWASSGLNADAHVVEACVALQLAEDWISR